MRLNRNRIEQLKRIGHADSYHSRAGLSHQSIIVSSAAPEPVPRAGEPKAGYADHHRAEGSGRPSLLDWRFRNSKGAGFQSCRVAGRSEKNPPFFDYGKKDVAPGAARRVSSQMQVHFVVDRGIGSYPDRASKWFGA